MRFPLCVDNSGNERNREFGIKPSGWVDVRDADNQVVASFYMHSEAENLANAMIVVEAANRAFRRAA